jgi:hypothetical protein
MKSFLSIVVFILLASLWLSCRKNNVDEATGLTTVKGKIDFNFQVKPILSDKCFACHGPDANKRQADFRLDNEEGAFKALKSNSSHFAIVKGNTEESVLIKRIF